MSTSPYSYDLRQKVMNYLNEGHSKQETARIFDIHKNTISRWCARYKIEGHFKERKRLGLKSQVDKEALSEFVTHNPDSKLNDIGQKFNITGTQARRILKKIGFSYKKKRLVMKKPVQNIEKNI